MAARLRISLQAESGWTMRLRMCLRNVLALLETKRSTRRGRHQFESHDLAAKEGRRRTADTPSSASRMSMPGSFGMSKSGASSFTTEVLTARAKALSGRSHDPRYAATAQKVGSALEPGLAPHRAVKRLISRAAAAMLGHGSNVVSVTAAAFSRKPREARRRIGPSLFSKR